jgi:hypothetical protein
MRLLPRATGPWRPEVPLRRRWRLGTLAVSGSAPDPNHPAHLRFLRRVLLAVQPVSVQKARVRMDGGCGQAALAKRHYMTNEPPARARPAVQGREPRLRRYPVATNPSGTAIAKLGSPLPAVTPDGQRRPDPRQPNLTARPCRGIMARARCAKRSITSDAFHQSTPLSHMERAGAVPAQISCDLE